MTELPQLREMGFEVFCPAYISPVYDQSADRTIDLNQHTTLPPEVFQELISYDFFYRPIEPRISLLLNEYFDAAICTISADWMKAFIQAFDGPVIYRVYGQHFSLSEKMLEIGLWEKIMTRPNFSIVPFAAESVEFEQNWFHDLCPAIVPYQIPDDVFDHSATWAENQHRKKILTHIPNVENPYFAENYNAFNIEYPNNIFDILGPQRSHPADSRIVGALARSEFLKRLKEASGFLYNYKDAVCYLTPIEMMEVGGPVLYAPGSLLARFYYGDTPGLLSSKQAAEKKLGYLLADDQAFISEVIAAQEPIRRRYDRALVRPEFDKVFRNLLGNPEREPALSVKDHIYTVHGRDTLPASVPIKASPRETLALLLHADGLFGYTRGKAYAFEGIPRVMEAVVQALVERSDVNFLITCTGRSKSVVYDFFNAFVKAGRVELYALGATEADDGGLVNDLERLRLMEYLNSRSDIDLVIVPHYYLFPESLLFKRTTTLYLPDYFPHLQPDAVFDTSREKDQENKVVGVAIAKRSNVIFTSSNYTKNYLADAGFIERGEEDKVCVVPLPLLGARQTVPLTRDREAELKRRIAGRRFIFYPTANRPNKRLNFFLHVFAVMRMAHPDLAAVLTSPLGMIAGVGEVADQYNLKPHLEIMPRIGDDEMAWLYRNASALCLTSTLEGNFPPQVLEALSYDTPLVATRLPPILDELGDMADKLLLCPPLDLEAFCSSLEVAFAHREDVIRNQQEVLMFRRKLTAPEVFLERLNIVLSKAKGDARGAL